MSSKRCQICCNKKQRSWLGRLLFGVCPLPFADERKWFNKEEVPK